MGGREKARIEQADATHGRCEVQPVRKRGQPPQAAAPDDAEARRGVGQVIARHQAQKSRKQFVADLADQGHLALWVQVYRCQVTSPCLEVESE